jgi:hypothetical protein
MKRKLATIALLTVGVSCLCFADQQTSKTDGRLWLGTSVSYELPTSTNLSYELGAGLYGLGGGVNSYLQSPGTGPMVSARVGYWGLGFAANALFNYVGSFSGQFYWRLGAGVEYVEGSLNGGGSGVFGSLNINVSSFIPMAEASLGFRF